MKNLFLPFLASLGFVHGQKNLKTGDSLPLIELKNSKDQVISTAQFKGSWTVLYFYPKADTPGCTTQAKQYTKAFEEFQAEGIRVFGISTDKPEALRKFKEKYGLKPEYLSDPEGQLAQALGVKMTFGFCSRDTIIINPELKIEKIFRGVDPSADAQNVLNIIRELKKSRS